MTVILTHRGLDPSIPDFPTESSELAFTNHISRNFGLEFDVVFLGDDSIAVFHDSNLARVTGNKDSRSISDMDAAQFSALTVNRCNFIMLQQLLEHLRKSGADLNALHFKGKLQTEKNIANLAKILNLYADIFSRLIVFDLYPQTADVLSDLCPGLGLACSVSRDFDIVRYGAAVSNTLLSVEQYRKHSKLFSWVWLDEWDLSTADGGTEEFYTAETFAVIRNYGAKIALVTPELHASSPGLLGSEFHQDASSADRLKNRIKSILSLRPDAVCTDYPDLVSAILHDI